MFARILNKENGHCLDLSTFINCSPEDVLFYYKHSHIEIGLDTYRQMQEWKELGDSLKPFLDQWLDLIHDEIGAGPDLLILQENEHLNSIGPYYYPETNTRFFFARSSQGRGEPLTSNDFASLLALHQPVSPNQELQKYLRNRKSPRKPAKNKEELINDISMCITALQEIHNIERQQAYLGCFLEEREALMGLSNIGPMEPENPPQKPSKPTESDPVPPNLLGLRLAWPRRPQQDILNYNFELKVYFIRYREYEKACDRFKEALKEWPRYSEDFQEDCQWDIREAREKLKKARSHLDLYQNMLRKNYIHSAYQDLNTLTTFKHYLETGRANTLQDCMNLYEEEQHWREIKASQRRIENTIYFLQSEVDPIGLIEAGPASLVASTLDEP